MNDAIQSKIELTPDQRKAWTQLVRAINRCKKENVFFYQVLETLNGLNGHNVRTVRCCNDKRLSGSIEQVYEDDRRLDFYDYPSVDTTCSFADDTHYVEFHTD